LKNVTSKIYPHFFPTPKHVFSLEKKSDYRTFSDLKKMIFEENDFFEDFPKHFRFFQLLKSWKFNFVFPQLLKIWKIENVWEMFNFFKKIRVRFGRRGEKRIYFRSKKSQSLKPGACPGSYTSMKEPMVLQAVGGYKYFQT